VKLEGRWDRYLDMSWVDSVTGHKGAKKRLWEMKEAIVTPSNTLPPFSASLNAFDDTLKEIVLPTDSRRRLDRLYLESGDFDSATQWKKIMEDRQRTDRKKRTEKWEPLWFTKVDDDTHETKSMWVYVGDYWEQRDKKVAILESVGSEEAKVLLSPPEVVGLACDFASYNGTRPAPDGETGRKREKPKKKRTKASTGSSTPTLEPPSPQFDCSSVSEEISTPSTSTVTLEENL